MLISLLNGMDIKLVLELNPIIVFFGHTVCIQFFIWIIVFVHLTHLELPQFSETCIKIFNHTKKGWFYNLSIDALNNKILIQTDLYIIW